MRNVLLDIERIIGHLKFKPSDARIYSLLLEKGEMRVSEIAKELDLSTRFVRDRLKELCARGIVKRKMVKKGWIGYVYKAEKPIEVIKKLKSKVIDEIESIERLLLESVESI